MSEANPPHGQYPDPPSPAYTTPPVAPTSGGWASSTPPTSGPPVSGPPTSGPPASGPPASGPPASGPPAVAGWSVQQPTSSPPGQQWGASPGYPATYPQSGPPAGYPVPVQSVQPAYPGYPATYGASAVQPVGYQQQYDAMGRPLSDKSKVVAGVLGIALGGFGAGRFYTGHAGIAIAMIVVTFVTCGLGHFWGLIDGIMILVNGGTDAQGRVLRD
jgi:TM2 domain-containing membrane protein YozV